LTSEQRAALRRLDRQFDAIRAMPEPIASRERYRHGIEEVGTGDYLRVSGELHRVELVSEYREKSSRWHELELFGLESGTPCYVEWEKDDEIEVSVNGPELSLGDIGVTADQIEEMSDEESGSISYDGRTYHYDDDYGATFHRDGEGEGEAVHFYDFETRDERFCLAVEEWGSASEGYEYAAFVAEYVGPDAVEVVALPAPSSAPSPTPSPASSPDSGA
jgi:hypothetical protein